MNSFHESNIFKLIKYVNYTFYDFPPLVIIVSVFYMWTEERNIIYQCGPGKIND